jgi:hypothetical protein
VRVGGWGPLFGGAVILTAVILIVALPLTPGKTGLALAVMGIAFLSAITTMGVWWARYTPQLLILPLVAVVLAEYTGSRMARCVGWVLIAVMAANAGVVSVAYAQSEARVNRVLKPQLHEMSRSSKPIVVWFGDFRSNRARLDAKEITYREVKEEKDLPDPSHAQYITGSTAKFCYEHSP